MDIVTLGAALSGAKKYTDDVVHGIAGGITYKGEVNYYNNLPSNPTLGDAYTVKYSGTTGSNPDGTEYVWADNGGVAQWVDFSKDAYTKAETDALLNNKQNVLTVGTNLDDEPIEDSTNPITSGGVYNTVGNLDAALDSLIMSLEPKTITANGTYNPTDDGIDGYSEVTVNVPQGGGHNAPTLTLGVCKPLSQKYTPNKDFISKTWNNAPESIYGYYVWNDGTDIYYSNYAEQYVLDKSTSTWNPKTWTGLSTFYGNGIWTDGDTIYVSYDSNTYSLDKSTSTWSRKLWSGYTDIKAAGIWTDGINVFYSNGVNQYVLDKSTSTWNPKTWTGLSTFYGYFIWSDGTNIYHSNGTDNYKLNIATSTWERFQWTVSGIDGRFVWSDGDNIYYSNGSNQYYLAYNSEWKNMGVWNGLSAYTEIWSDGANIYRGKNLELKYFSTTETSMTFPRPSM